MICSRYFPRTPGSYDVLTKVSFHPIDPTIVVVSGNGHLKQYYINQGDDELAPAEFDYSGSLKPVSEYVFTDHLWSEEGQLLACTKTGELFVYQVYDLV